MARPKKNSPSPSAKDRMIDALWRTLETYDIDEVTVSMITSAADCNRGSFYYHFSSLQELSHAAFERDCVNSDRVARALLALVSGNHVEAARAIFDEERVRKMGLIGDRGGTAIAGTGTCAALDDVWLSIACGAGEPCTVGARNTIDFANFGIARFVNTAAHAKPANKILAPNAIFLRDLAFFILHEISRFQHIEEAEIMARLERLAKVHTPN